MASTVAAEPTFPTFPAQFRATVEVTAHLVDRSKPYPPWKRVIAVDYDGLGGRVRASVEEGHEEGKTFLRRYDNKTEFMVRGLPYPECQRAYLGEALPPPRLPDGFVFAGREVFVPGLGPCDHWVHDIGTNRVHVWVREHDGGGAWPVRVGPRARSLSLSLWCLAYFHVHHLRVCARVVRALLFVLIPPQLMLVCVAAVCSFSVQARVTDEQVMDGESVPLMTYDWRNLRVGGAAAAAWEASPIAAHKAAAHGDRKAPMGEQLGGTFGIPEPHDWRSCARNIGGFPYLHIFHHYVRF